MQGAISPATPATPPSEMQSPKPHPGRQSILHAFMVGEHTTYMQERLMPSLSNTFSCHEYMKDSLFPRQGLEMNSPLHYAAFRTPRPACPDQLDKMF